MNTPCNSIKRVRVIQSALANRTGKSCIQVFCLPYYMEIIGILFPMRHRKIINILVPLFFLFVFSPRKTSPFWGQKEGRGQGSLPLFVLVVQLATYLPILRITQCHLSGKRRSKKIVPLLYLPRLAEDALHMSVARMSHLHWFILSFLSMLILPCFMGKIRDDSNLQTRRNLKEVLSFAVIEANVNGTVLCLLDYCLSFVSTFADKDGSMCLIPLIAFSS